MSPLRVNGAELLATVAGALWWPARRCLVVADLHLEKGSAFARGGQFLPPYDSRATLEALARLCREHEPASVVCLGDSFHDRDAAGRLAPEDGALLRDLTAGRDWVWIQGNHDPEPPADWGGRVTPELVEGPLVFRHEALAGRPAAGEISGHFHPKASVRVRSRRLTGRCFVTDGRRLVLPAFGAFTGGLSVLDPAISGLFPRGYQVHLLGRERAFLFPREALVA